MLNNVLLHGDTEANLMVMLTKRMKMTTLMMMLVLRTVFGAIVKVWEVIKIVVIMILLLKKILICFLLLALLILRLI